jgi:hypothetical protein
MRYREISKPSTITSSTHTNEIPERVESAPQLDQPRCENLESHVRYRADDLMRRAFEPVWKDVFTNIEDVL